MPIIEKLPRLRDVIRPGVRLAAAFAAGATVACGGSPSSPSDVEVAGLTLDVRSGLVRLARFPGDRMAIEYEWCYSIAVADGMRGEVMTIHRMESTVLGPGGVMYHTSTDPSFEGEKIGGGATLGFFGCPVRYSDPDTTRPLATSYRTRLEYSFDSGSPAGTRTLTATGTFVSRVPTTPQMTGLTIAHDIDDPQLILRRPRPVTFTVAGTGGTPPYEFRWRLNGFELRGWDPSPTLVWDGATLGGNPVASGGLTLGVVGRSAGGNEAEAAATLHFIVRFQ